MKSYRVDFSPEARNDAIAAARFIARDAPSTAIRWYEGLAQAIESLTTLPSRCTKAREAEFLNADVRNLLYKSHRIIFRIDERSETVRILHIRHASRRAIGESGEAR